MKFCLCSTFVVFVVCFLDFSSPRYRQMKLSLWYKLISIQFRCLKVFIFHSGFGSWYGIPLLDDVWGFLAARVNQKSNAAHLLDDAPLVSNSFYRSNCKARLVLWACQRSTGLFHQSPLQRRITSCQHSRFQLDFQVSATRNTKLSSVNIQIKHQACKSNY